MKLEHMLEVEHAIHEIEERAERNRLGMLVTQEVANYRAHGARKDVETLLAVVNAVLDELVVGSHNKHPEDLLEVIYKALTDEEEGEEDVAV